MDSVKNFFRCIPIALILFFSLPAFAQKTGTLTLNLKDATSGESVPFATVSLTKKGATSPSKYILSNNEGKAVLDNVSLGDYTLKAELLGYKVYSKEVKVSGNLNLGEVKMDPDVEALKAAEVSAAGNPIIMKKDTIEYNASSFKTTDNDMLEDLLKKLPGVEVGEDGSVTANGQTIKKITIDGKTFFLDDPQLASKNIPAKIIEKVKVVEKKSDQAEFTGIDDGNEETIIDLSIQRGMMNGLFGNLMAGVGHDVRDKQTSTAVQNDNGDWRYQGAGFVGRFTEKNQLSIIVNGNNTNNRGFNDVAGSMMRGMRGGGGGMGGGRGGWGSGNGITTSWMAGINGNTNLFDDKMQLGGNYLYNNTANDVEEQSVETTMYQDYNRIYETKGISSTNTDGHRFGIRLEHKFSDNTSILFQPQVNFGSGNYNEVSEFATYKEQEGVRSTTNNGFTSHVGSNKNWQTNGFFLFRQRLGIPGRTLTFNVMYNFSNNDMNGFNQSLTTTYLDEMPSDSTINQRFDQNQKSKSLSGRLTYTEPLGKGFYVEVNYQLGWAKSISDKKTFDSGDFSSITLDNLLYNPIGETLNSTYTTEVFNRSITQQAGANVKYQKNKLHAQAGLNVNPTYTHNESTGYEVYDKHIVNWAPQAMLWYDINDNTNARLFYFGRSSQPSVSQLMKIPDNTNPNSVSFGNLYLDPYFTHSFRGEFRLSNRKSYFSLNTGIDGNIVTDPIVNAQWDGLNGVRYSIPINGDDSFNMNWRMFLNTPIAKSNFSIASMSRVGYTHASSYVGESQLDMTSYYDGEMTADNFDVDKFVGDFDKLPFSTNRINTFSATERLRFTYRNDNLELTASGRTSVNKSWYTVNQNANTNWIWNNQVRGSVNWTLPAGFGLESDVSYNWYRGYETAMDDEVIVNAKITKLLFKKKFTLALNVYDLLNESKNLSISDYSISHKETVNNTLGRYVILSLTYRFGNFGGNRGGGNHGGGPRGGFGGPGGGPRGPRP